MAGSKIQQNEIAVGEDTQLPPAGISFFHPLHLAMGNVSVPATNNVFRSVGMTTGFKDINSYILSLTQQGSGGVIDTGLGYNILTPAGFQASQNTTAILGAVFTASWLAVGVRPFSSNSQGVGSTIPLGQFQVGEDTQVGAAAGITANSPLHMAFGTATTALDSGGIGGSVKVQLTLGFKDANSYIVIVTQVISAGSNPAYVAVGYNILNASSFQIVADKAAVTVSWLAIGVRPYASASFGKGSLIPQGQIAIGEDTQISAAGGISGGHPLHIGFGNAVTTANGVYVGVGMQLGFKDANSYIVLASPILVPGKGAKVVVNVLNANSFQVASASDAATPAGRTISWLAIGVRPL